MSEPVRPEQDPSIQSFSAYVRAFHEALPPAEQKMLEFVFALADAAAGQGNDVQGFGPRDRNKFEAVTLDKGLVQNANFSNWEKSLGTIDGLFHSASFAKWAAGA